MFRFRKDRIKVKFMKNKTFALVLLLPLVAGICGAFLRGAQFTEAFENSDGFISGSTPFANGLLILCILVFAMTTAAALLFTKYLKPSKRDTSKRSITISLWIAGSIILIYALLILKTLADGFTVINLILALFSVYCSVSLFILGKYKLKELESSAYCIMSVVPVFWACFMLILTFREKISDPVIWDYVFHIFAYLSVLLSTYSIAAHALGKKKVGVTVFTCFCGIFFFLTELISPFLSGGNIELNLAKVTELLPSLAFLILIPFVTAEVLNKNNQ